MIPIDHFSKFKPGEIVLQVSLSKIEGMPFVVFKFDKIPEDSEAQIFAMSIISTTLAATLADITGNSKEYQAITKSLTNLAGRKTPQFADEELR